MRGEKIAWVLTLAYAYTPRNLIFISYYVNASDRAWHGGREGRHSQHIPICSARKEDSRTKSLKTNVSDVTPVVSFFRFTSFSLCLVLHQLFLFCSYDVSLVGCNRCDLNHLILSCFLYFFSTLFFLVFFFFISLFCNLPVIRNRSYSFQSHPWSTSPPLISRPTSTN